MYVYIRASDNVPLVVPETAINLSRSSFSVFVLKENEIEIVPAEFVSTGEFQYIGKIPTPLFWSAIIALLEGPNRVDFFLYVYAQIKTMLRVTLGLVLY